MNPNPFIRLGLIGPSPEDRRVLLFSSFVNTREIVYPKAEDTIEGRPYDTDPLFNDLEGDCTIAGPGHYVRALDIPITRDHVHREYRLMSGGLDTGLFASDVMKKWRNEGLWNDSGVPGNTPIKAFLKLDHRNIEQMAAAVSLFGNMFLCSSLTAQCVDPETEIWDVKPGDKDVGNHLEWIHSQSPQVFVANTWGWRKPRTANWILERSFEAWTVVHPASLRKNGRTASYLDMEGLDQALAQLSK